MSFSMNLLSAGSLTKAFAGAAAYDAFMGAAAKNVADYAKSNAPGLEGDYIEAEGHEVRYQNPRGVWHIVEFGSVNNHPYSPLRRGVQAAGLRLDEAPKP